MAITDLAFTDTRPASRVSVVADAPAVLDRVGRALVLGVVLVLLNRTGLERVVPGASTLLRLIEFGLIIAVSGLGIARRPTGQVQCGVLLFVLANISAYLYGAAYLDGGPPAFAIATSVGYLPLFAASGLALPDRWLTAVVGWASVPGLLLGARQAVFGLSPVELEAVTGARATYLVDGHIRLPGAFGTGQEFSVWLAVLVIMSLGQMLTRPERRARLGFGVLGSVAAVLLVLALQRTGIIIAAVGGAGTIFFTYRKAAIGLKVKVLGLGSATLFTVLMGALLSSPERASTGLERLIKGSETSTLGGRATSLWSDAFDRVTAWPLFGGGPGSATAASFVYRDSLLVRPLVTDNLALHVATQTGIIGVAAFAFLLVSVGREAGPRPWIRGLLFGLAAGGIAASLLGLIGVMGLIALLMTSRYQPEPAS